MIEKIKIWFWRWFAPERYVAYIAKAAMEDAAKDPTLSKEAVK